MFHALEIPAFSNAVNGSKDVPVFVLGLIDLNHLHVALGSCHFQAKASNQHNGQDAQSSKHQCQ